MLVTESPDWDAPKPPVSMTTNNKLEKSGNQGHINHRNWSLSLSLLLMEWPTMEPSMPQRVREQLQD